MNWPGVFDGHKRSFLSSDPLSMLELKHRKFSLEAKRMLKNDSLVSSSYATQSKGNSIVLALEYQPIIIETWRQQQKGKQYSSKDRCNSDDRA